MKYQQLTVAATAALMVGALVAPPGNAQNRYRVVGYGVDTYSGNGNCSWSSLTGAVNDSKNFVNWTKNMSVFTSQLTLQNDSVRDNYLKDASLFPSDSWDETNIRGIDHYQNAIAYFAGHGTCGPGGRQGANANYVTDCDLQSPGAPAWCAAQHPNPGAGEFAPVMCRDEPRTAQPDGTKGVCRYRYSHAPITCATGDVPDENGVGYSQVGTRGIEVNNTPLSVFSISCGAHLDSIVSDLGAALDGGWMIGTVHVVSGDTATTAERGDMFGYFAQLDVMGKVTDAWMDALWNMPNAGSGCTHSTGGVDGGINGCGGHVMFAAGWNANDAIHTRDSARFFDLRYADWGEPNPAHFAWKYNCNYDCFNNPPFFN